MPLWLNKPGFNRPRVLMRFVLSADFERLGGPVFLLSLRFEPLSKPLSLSVLLRDLCGESVCPTTEGTEEHRGFASRPCLLLLASAGQVNFRFPLRRLSCYLCHHARPAYSCQPS